MNTEHVFNISDILRAVANGMYYPVIVILIVFLLGAVALLGWIAVEYFTERRHMKIHLPRLLEDLQHTEDLKGSIGQSGLLRRQLPAAPGTGPCRPRRRRRA